jgi:glycosyltransferase involved in cell wall biosynthesis
MTFTVVMPSYLAPYAGAANNREGKLLRAINSVLAQTFTDLELMVIADGCTATEDLVKSNINDERVHLLSVQHQRMWSGTPRNKGIEEGHGDYIVYLDIDDIYGENHLEIINNHLDNYDWVWYNDITYKPKDKNWYERHCDINVISMHGTSNICHRRSLGVWWDEHGRYAHDYYFIKKLHRFRNNTKIKTPEYFVCHIPGGAEGYDL